MNRVNRSEHRQCSGLGNNPSRAPFKTHGHTNLCGLLLWAAVSAILLGITKAFTPGAMVEELLILCSWITAVVALLAVCGWKATAVASAGVWIAFHASFALVPDVSGDGPLLPGMIAAIGGGCIEGLLFFMLAKWLFHIMDRLWKMVASYCRQAGSEAQRICSEQKYSFQFRASILIPIGALVLIPLIWLGVVLHGILMDTRTVSLRRPRTGGFLAGVK